MAHCLMPSVRTVARKSTFHPFLFLNHHVLLNPAISRSWSSLKLMGEVEQRIFNKLQEILCPEHLEVLNESSGHNVPRGSETHFKVVVVTEVFEGKSLLQRHRLINEALREELQGPVHALSIVGKTPDQWNQSPQVSKSPRCMGGSRN